MPASPTAKSAAVDVGNFTATNSEKSVNPSSPAQPGQVAIALVTEVWNSRIFDRSRLRVSTLTSMPAVLPSRLPPVIFTFTSAHLPCLRSATASVPEVVVENSTRL